jgi:hypothetical protein
MLTFKEFMTAESLGSTRYGTGTGRTMSLRTGMLHNRQAASRMYSPKPPIGVDFDAWLHHNINNIANVLENLYHRYEANDLVTVNKRLCMASSEIEHWHEATVKKLIDGGVLVQMPSQNVVGRWLERDLSDSVPSFEHHAPVQTKTGQQKSKSMFFTTEETLGRLTLDPEMHQEIQEWIAHGRMAAEATPINGVIFYAVNTTRIILMMQRQKDIFGAMNVAGNAMNLAMQSGGYKADPNLAP